MDLVFIDSNNHQSRANPIVGRIHGFAILVMDCGIAVFSTINPVSTRPFSHPICTGGRGKFAPLFKNCLVIEVRFFTC